MSVSISMTMTYNLRKDMIDEAILRPGRLELHVEIGLPDENGRLQVSQAETTSRRWLFHLSASTVLCPAPPPPQIISIHTSKMRASGRLRPDAEERLGELAQLTKNFTGELEGCVRMGHRIQ